jgi:hypothetical protein
MNKKIILLVSALVFISSTALALRVPMWRKMFEQNKTTYYKDEGSLRFSQKQWEFGHKKTNPNVEGHNDYTLCGIAQCKRSEEGMWFRMIRTTECYDGHCHKVKDEDWQEYESDTIGFYVCEIALPKCRKVSDKNCTIYDP